MKRVNKDVYYSLQYIFVIFASFCAVFSQLESIAANSLLKIAMTYFPWLLVGGYLVLMTRRVYYSELSVLIIPMVFVGLFALGYFFGMLYRTNIFIAVCISTYILFIGFLLGKNVEKEHFYVILRSFVIITAVFGLYYYIRIFGAVNFVNAKTLNVGGGKNAIPMLFLASILMLLFSKKVLPIILKYFLVTFFVFLIILFQSRMVMLTAFIMIIMRLFLSDRGVKDKLVYGLLIGIVFYLLFTNEQFYNVTIKQVFLRNKEITEENMYAISSGRNEQFARFLNDFKQSWFIGGTSHEGYENFYLYTLAVFGIVGMSILALMLIAPFYYCYKYRRFSEDKDLRVLVLAFIIAFLINGLGEALTPFGPGVKCFTLWLVFGYYLGYSKRKVELIRYEKSINNYSGVQR